MKYAAMLCICLSVAGAGVAASARSRRRVETLEGIAAFFECMALCAGMFGGEIEALLAHCENTVPAARAFPAALHEGLSHGEDIETAWRGAARRWPDARLLHPEESALLASFGGVFACRSMEGFRENCGMYGARFAEMHRGASEKNKKTGRLYAAFGSLFAALLLIILL